MSTSQSKSGSKSKLKHATSQVSKARSDPAWLKEAERHLGTAEWSGRRHNPAIVTFFARAGFSGIRDDETPWCAAFVNAVMADCGLPTTGKLTARSFLRWGRAIDRAERGAIAVFRRGKSTWQGHVGFVVDADAKYIHVLGGNQSNAVTVARYPRSKLLGLRWPVA
ncbi:MAG: TIGR02594 family protein [Pseudomonadota bacterium]